MRSARLSAALRGSTFAVALAATFLPAQRPAAQDAVKRFRGAILVHAVDTSINPLHAEIMLPAFEVAARGNEDGAVLFVNVPDGLYLLQARHLGYRPEWRFVLVTGDTTRLEMVLPPADVRAGARRIGLPESRLREFLRRTTAIPLGTFLTRGEIERRRARNLVALLARVPDVVVDRSATGATVVRSERAVEPQCASGMLLLVDAAVPTTAPVPAGETRDGPHEPRFIHGLRPERFIARAARRDPAQPLLDASLLGVVGDGAGDDPRGAGARRTLSVIERIPMAHVAAVEVYPTLTGVPAEFRVSGAECGLVLVWTGAGRG
jgi:hypothetical protein